MGAVGGPENLARNAREGQNRRERERERQRERDERDEKIRSKKK